MAGGGQLALDIVDREVSPAQGDGPFPHPIAGGRRLRPPANRLKEAGALAEIMAKLMTEDAEGSWGIAEASGDLLRGQAFDEKAAQGLILALQRRFGGQEELGLRSGRSGVIS